MKKILFVDDEPKLLEGLQRMLRTKRREWDMTFVTSASDALAAMEKEPFHILVTDMRMPGMDGSELLKKVEEFHPQVVRIVLSGHTDKEMILRTVGPAHQYLSKPCDVEALKATLSRACSLSDILSDAGLVRVVSGIESLPSIPSLYSEVLQEINSPEGSLNKVGEIITKDFGMSAKILQLVSSSFFGLPTHVSNPVRACQLLGLETIKALVLSVGIFSQFSKSRDFSVDALWEHSMSTALLARDMAVKANLGQDSVDDAFMAGLLHDIGKLILMDKTPEEFRQICELANSTNCSALEAEQRVLGTTHAQVGAYLLGIWGLPEPIVEAVAWHHSPKNRHGGTLDTITAVHLAETQESGNAEN
jgi:putative nucleotidyltransferase with HDIG domain